MNAQTITATLDTADQEAVLTAIANVQQKLPFLVDLSTMDRRTISKLGDKSEAFVRKAVDIATQTPQLLPAGFDVNQMRNSAQLFESLSIIQLALDHLQKQVDDTTMLVGSQAMASARTLYGLAKTSLGGAALEPAAIDLSQRFVRKTRRKPAAPAEVSSSPATHSAQT